MINASLDAGSIVTRARAAAAGGRLPLGTMQSWGNFPYDGDVCMRPLGDVELPEPAREGDDPSACSSCGRADETFLWSDADWRVASATKGSSLPLFFLSSRGHYDLDELPMSLQSALGPMMVRLERAIASVQGVARVHIDRWGDGAHHLHLFFYARPAGLPQLKGLFMPSWMDALPALPDDEATAIEQHVAAALG